WVWVQSKTAWLSPFPSCARVSPSPSRPAPPPARGKTRTAGSGGGTGHASNRASHLTPEQGQVLHVQRTQTLCGQFPGARSHQLRSRNDEPRFRDSETPCGNPDHLVDVDAPPAIAPPGRDIAHRALRFEKPARPAL